MNRNQTWPKRPDYKKKKSAKALLVLSILYFLIGFALLVGTAYQFIDWKAGEARAKGRVEEFDAYKESWLGQCWETLSIQAISYEFAEDFKGTYQYYLAFTPLGEIRIVKLKGGLPEEYMPLLDYLFEEDAEIPDPVELRGVSAPVEEDIKEYALDALNDMYGEEVFTEADFDEYVGVCFLDTTGKPAGAGSGREVASLAVISFICLGAALFFLILSRKTKYTAIEDENRERATMSQMAAYGSQGTGGAVWNPTGSGRASGDAWVPAGSGEDGNAGWRPVTASQYDNFHGQSIQGTGSYGQAGPYGGARRGTDELKKLAASQNPERESNVLLGLLGAVGGSLVGVLAWVLIGQIGFIAGIAGFLMLKFALSGYAKLSGRLDKKGAVLCLLIAALMIVAANFLDIGLQLCRAYFAYEASLDTVRYVAFNLLSLMDTHELWPDFFRNLLIGFGLSVWSSYGLIRSVLHYEER